jgi:hypothetical protein
VVLRHDVFVAEATRGPKGRSTVVERLVSFSQGDVDL